MTFGLYAIRDVKTGFMSPTVDSSDAAAIRNFNSSIMRSDGLFLTHSADFSLYRLGDYDSDSGLVSPLSVPLFLASGSDAIQGG